MYVILLTFGENRDQVGAHMAGHKAWLKQGFDDGVFVLAGSLQPGLGGGILAHGVDRADLEDRVASDPFVKEKVVEVVIHELSLSLTDPRLDFLKAGGAA